MWVTLRDCQNHLVARFGLLHKRCTTSYRFCTCFAELNAVLIRIPGWCGWVYLRGNNPKAQEVILNGYR
jgi:hypothetical protein